MRNAVRVLIPAALLGSLIGAVAKQVLVTAGAPLWLIVGAGAVAGGLGAALFGYRLCLKHRSGGPR